MANDAISCQDHVAYPTKGPSNFLSTGDCPSTHPVKIPQLMLEVRLNGSNMSWKRADFGRLSGILPHSTTRLTGRLMDRSRSISRRVTILAMANTAIASLDPAMLPNVY